MTRHSAVSALSSTLFLLALNACGGGGDGPTEPPPSAPVPSRIIAVQGLAQVGTVGQRLPEALIAEVRDQNGNPMAGQGVAFTVMVGGGSVNPAGGTTDQNGQALTIFTLGPRVGPQAVRAQSGALSVDFNANAEAGDAAQVVKSAGDNQAGALGTLSAPLEVQVTDAFDNPVVGVTVAFAADKGTLTSTTATTDAQGKASTTLTFPAEEGVVTVTATVDGLEAVTFSLAAEEVPLAVTTDRLDDARQTLTFSGQLAAEGGSATGYAWSLAQGTLPGGISLADDGSMSGTPTTEGTSIFTVQVDDDAGHTARKQLSLRVCEAPLSMAAGETRTFSAPGDSDCALFLPSGSDGDRYRVTVLNTSSLENAAAVSQVTFSVQGVGSVAAAPPGPSAAASIRPLPIRGLNPVALRRSIAIAEATERYHRELRAREVDLVRRLGLKNLLPDRRREASFFRAAQASSTPDSVIMLDPTTPSTCSTTSGGPRVAAKLVAFNDDMAIYQDTAQIRTKPATASQAQRMLDYYSSYARDMIDAYFGRPSDINDDGRIVVFLSPAVSGNMAAFVWSGDFFNTSSCGNSNEMEMVYFNTDLVRSMDDKDNPNYQALETVAHEVKHVVSLYHRLSAGHRLGTPDFHPSWIEEGTAEIAGGMSSRIAWAATGGPAVGAKVRRSDFVSSGITPENYGVLLRMARTIWFLSSQPNGIVVSPQGAGDGHSIYGTGWNFHRWLGDAYGNAVTPEADSTLFRTLSDSLYASGIDGLEAYTGKSWENLLEEFVTAVTLHGVGPTPGRAITSYDFITATDVLKNQPNGVYPWPVTEKSGASGTTIPAGFTTATYQGPIGLSGMRIHDFQSNGTGLGMEFRVNAEPPVEVVVVRVR